MARVSVNVAMLSAQHCDRAVMGSMPAASSFISLEHKLCYDSKLLDIKDFVARNSQRGLSESNFKLGDKNLSSL